MDMMNPRIRASGTSVVHIKTWWIIAVFSVHNKTTKSVIFNKCFNNYGFLITLWYFFLQIFLKSFLSGFIFSSVQLLSHIWLVAIRWTAVHQASLFITNSWSLLKLMSIESVMPSKHLIVCHPLLFHLQSFPASGSFLVSQLFTSDGRSIRGSASTSVLPVYMQDWFPLGWTGWISLSKGFSRVFSNTTVQKHQFFGAQPSL